MIIHPGTIIGGAILISIGFCGYLLYLLMGQFMRLLIGGPWDSYLIVAKIGPVGAFLLQALPFLLLGFLVYRKVSNKTVFRAAMALLVGAYVFVGYRTQLPQEAAFRMTSIGRQFHDFRWIVQACHAGHAKDDLGLNSRHIRMSGCLDSLPQQAIDDWCNRIFSAKRPFNDFVEAASCTKRSKRLAGVEKWPNAKNFVTAASIPSRNR